MTNPRFSRKGKHGAWKKAALAISGIDVITVHMPDQSHIFNCRLTAQGAEDVLRALRKAKLTVVDR